MSRSYIDPRFMDAVRGKSLQIQAVWFSLLMHRAGQGVPGLILVDRPLLLASMGVNDGSVEQGLDGLKALGLLQEDPTVTLMRVPHAPSWYPKPGPDNIRGWWRQWQTTPESRLKYDHLESLRRAVDLRTVTPAAKAWGETFGSASYADAEILNPQQNLSFHTQIQVPGQVVPPPVNQGGYPPGSGYGSGSGSGEGSGTGDGSGGAARNSQGGKIFDLAEGSQVGAPVALVPTDLLGRAKRAWARQEELRAQVGGLPPLKPTSANLERVVACLKATGADDSQVDHVLRVYASNATRDPRKHAQWFDGSSNWRPESFRVASGKPLDSSGYTNGNGHFKPTGTENYDDGGTEMPEFGPGVRQML